MNSNPAASAASRGFRLAFFALVLVLSACATAPGLSYVAVQPAKAVEASKLRHVAVLRFDGWHGEAASEALDTALRRATFQNMDWFRVGPDEVDYDPSFPGGDGRYSTSIGGDMARAIEYGRQHGLDGVWFGDTSAWSTNSGVFTKTKTRCVKWAGPFNCKTEEEYDVQCYDIETEVEVHAKLVDVRTGRVVFNKDLSDEDTQRFCSDDSDWRWNEWSSPIHEHDFDLKERDMIADCARRFAAYVTPGERLVTAELMQAPYFPYAELAAGFPLALDAAEGDMAGNACGRFEAMAADYPDEPAVIFNLGVCAEMRGEAEAANGFYDAAVLAAGPSPRAAFLEQVDKARARLVSLKSDEALMDAIYESRDQFPRPDESHGEGVFHEDHENDPR